MQNRLFLLMIFLSMLFWGLGWINGKIVTRYLSPEELIFMRYIFASSSLFLVHLWLKSSLKISLKSLILSFISACVLVAYTKFFFLGIKHGAAGLGSAFSSTLIPIITFLLLAMFFKKPILKKDIYALILGVIGVFSIVGVWNLEIEQIFSNYNIFFAIASFLWSVLTLISARSTDTSALVFMLYMYIFTAFVSSLFVDIGSINFSSFDWLFWSNILMLSILGTTFSTSVYFIGVEKLGSKEVSSFVFLVPFTSMFFAWLLLGEKITFGMIAGTVLSICAVVILNNLKLPAFIDKYRRFK